MTPQPHPTITAYAMANALGTGRDVLVPRLRAGESGLVSGGEIDLGLDMYFGCVANLEEVTLPSSLARYACRNNRLALKALESDDFTSAVARAVLRCGAARVGLFLGTSTSGIAETETAYAERRGEVLPEGFDFHSTHELASLPRFVSAVLGLEGPSLVVSTACSSSAKVFGVAERYLRCGLCDAAVVGGVDSLCLTTIYGFNALELIAREPCRPWGHGRHGISIGEAAGFALLERGGRGVEVLGCGESSDAHHMSSPDPQGRGAEAALHAALAAADLQPAAVEYVNLHATGTAANDAAEDRAILAVFGRRVPCSGTKRATGHTLGAAGIVEALTGCLAMSNDFIPGGLTTGTIDPALGAHFLVAPQARRVRTLASLSLGFGGSNCVVLLRHAA